MGFLKKLGVTAGNVAGNVLGGSVKIIGKAVDSDFIKEVGNGVQKSTKNTGRVVGQVAEGTYKTVKGTVKKDKEELKSGIKDIGGAAGETAVGVGKGIGNLVGTSFGIIGSAVTGDNEEAKKGLTKIAKGMAIGAIGIGVLDGLDIIGDDDTDFSSGGFFDEDINNGIITESHVEPHHVEGYIRADGAVVDDYWRDGDGNTHVDLTSKDGGGFLRNNV